MFKDIIRDLRRQKNLTQTELGSALGFSHAAIGFWERGEKLPTYEALRKMALFFDVSADYLLGIIDEDGTRLVV
ncbi:MAG: helix-turn-helix domain-containing protein [Firmicutes bacterium]|nr:helix-turn-helix domain-containing protein [Bacillota bacterium]